jgi:hypothetical protein
LLIDGILALLGYISAYLVAWKTFLASSGFVVLASAAAVGAIKFAGFTRLSSFHRFLTEFAGVFSLLWINIKRYSMCFCDTQHTEENTKQ